LKERIQESYYAANINKGVCPTEEESRMLMSSVCKYGGRRAMGREGKQREDS
jgi:hypothetical protein